MTATKKTPMSRQIAEYIRANPNAKPADVATAVGTTLNYVYVVAHKLKGKATKKPKLTLTKKAIDARLKLAKIEGEKKMVRVFTGTSGQSITAHVDQITNLTPEQQERLVENLGKARIRMPVTMAEPKADNVNHPAHYKVGGIETIDFIEAKLTPEEFRGYLKGNVLKYLSRAGNKGNYEEDMLKARWYMNREIAKLQEYK